MIEQIIVQRDCVEDIQKKMTKALVAMNSGNAAKKRLVKSIQKGGLKKVLKFRFYPRMSSLDYSSAGGWWQEYARC